MSDVVYMEIFEQIHYSLSSVEARSDVKSLNMELKRCEVLISDIITIRCILNNPTRLIEFDLCEEITARSKRTNRKLKVTHVCGRDLEHKTILSSVTSTCIFINQKFSARDWIAHFLSIFNGDHIDVVNFTNNTYHIDSLKSALANFQIKNYWIHHKFSVRNTLKVLREFPPAKEIDIQTLSFARPSHDLALSQNFETFSLGMNRMLNLDQILLLNSKYISISSTMDSADINMFLKIWIKGGNSRMKRLEVLYLDLDYFGSLDVARIMKGINYDEVSGDVVKEVLMDCGNMYAFQLFSGNPRGGFEITRKRDGVKATIWFRARPIPAIEMIVWS